jgi:hypothetical protein
MSRNDFGAGLTRPLQSQMLGCGGSEQNTKTQGLGVSADQSSEQPSQVQALGARRPTLSLPSPLARQARAVAETQSRNLARIYRAAGETARQEAARATAQAAAAYCPLERADLLTMAARFSHMAQTLACEVAR